MRVPGGADAAELNRLLARLQTAIEVRASAANRQPAERLLDQIHIEISATFSGTTRHREWRARRPRVVEMVEALEAALRSHDHL